MISTVQGTFLQRKFAQCAIFRRGITHACAGAARGAAGQRAGQFLRVGWKVGDAQPMNGVTCGGGGKFGTRMGAGGIFCRGDAVGCGVRAACVAGLCVVRFCVVRGENGSGGSATK